MTTFDGEFGAPLSPDALNVVVRQHEGTLRRLLHWKGNADSRLLLHEAKQAEMHEDIAEIKKEVKDVKRLLVWLMTTITGSSIALAFSVLLATGKI
jgi:hypothetical protein